MNNMRVTEANRNFTALTRKVEDEGVVGIEKNGSLRYVMMTKERYDGMNTNVFYGKRGEELIKVELGNARIAIWQLARYKEAEDMAQMRKVNLPAKGVELKVADGRFEVIADLEDLRKKNPGESMSSEFNDLIMLNDEYGEYYEEMPEAWKTLGEARELADEFAAMDERSIMKGDLTFMVPGAKSKFNQLAPLQDV